MSVHSREEHDLIKLFRDKGDGTYVEYITLFPQVFTDKSDKWANFITEKSNYYLYRDEIQLINEKNPIINKLLNDYHHFIEIGPGSNDAMQQKSLKALSNLTQIKSYISIDINQSYSNNAASLMKQAYPSIATAAVACDLNHSGASFVPMLKHLDQKVFISFGCMIMNQNTIESVHAFIKNLADLMNKGDLIVLGVDTNQDASSALKAYEGNENMDLDILRYFHHKYKLLYFDPEQFELVSEWIQDDAKQVSFIKFNAQAKSDQEFEWRNDGMNGEGGMKFSIRKGEKLYLFRTNRFKVEFFKHFDKPFGLELKEVIQNSSDRVKLIVLRKIEF
jgi:uncharacterized SAM-dependent methyltransferase